MTLSRLSGACCPNQAMPTRRLLGGVASWVPGTEISPFLPGRTSCSRHVRGGGAPLVGAAATPSTPHALELEESLLAVALGTKAGCGRYREVRRARCRRRPRASDTNEQLGHRRFTHRIRSRSSKLRTGLTSRVALYSLTVSRRYPRARASPRPTTDRERKKRQ